MTYKKVGLLLLALCLGTCNQAIMNAPPGSSFAGDSLIANPPFIAANGDVSIISGLLMDGTGNPVPDGTVVQFFTDLGKIDEQGKTNDGVVRVNLVSDSRSGIAHVSAFSGGGANPVPSPSSSPMSAAPPVVAFSTRSVMGASDVAATQASATTMVTIGSANPDHVLLTANPPRITTGGSTQLLAQVFDERGNPVANVPVIFQITSASTVQGRLDSGGRQVFTDRDGRATDVLRTNSTVAGNIVVTVTTANGKQPSEPLTVPVFINP
jgi:hypothetical protein